ncbi:zinc ribbon domain-containing protein [Nonomuraea sp. NPDC049714]|uniref:zinc ribbon domain-containing protein n=1 Tax=Nonomuraea sp. NPDC049714 TaxID=3364357 RepID=UPI0037A74F65
MRVHRHRRVLGTVKTISVKREGSRWFVVLSCDDHRVSQAEFRRTACGHAAHADVNAAINILRAGLALRQAAEAA